MRPAQAVRRLVGKIAGTGYGRVVPKLDRLGRDTPVVLSAIKLLGTLGVEIVVLQLGKLEMASTSGKLMLTMSTAVAEMERDLIVERT